MACAQFQIQMTTLSRAAFQKFLKIQKRDSQHLFLYKRSTCGRRGGGCLVDTLIQKDFLRGRKGTELWNGFNDFGTSRKSQGKTPRITGNKWHGLAPVVPATQLIVYQLLFDLSCCPEVTVVASRQRAALSFQVRQFDGQRGLQSHSSHDFGKAVAGAASHRRSEPPSTGARAAALGVLCLRPPLTEQMF